jgi:hypothetical protein
MNEEERIDDRPIEGTPAPAPEATVAPDVTESATPQGNAVLVYIDEVMPELKEAPEEAKYEAVVEQLKKYRLFEEKMEELFASEPLMAELVSETMRGNRSFAQALGAVISPEELAYLLENEGEDVQAERQGRLSRLKEEQAAQQKRESINKESGANLDAFLESKSDWDDGKRQKFVANMEELASILSDNVITEKEYGQLANMVFHDELVSAAHEAGAVSGRNEQIQSRRLQKEAEQVTDGIPALEGGGSAPDDSANGKDPFEQHLDRRMAVLKKIRGE